MAGGLLKAIALANDLEQAQGRVFAAVRRIVEASPHLAREAQVTVNRIELPGHRRDHHGHCIRLCWCGWCQSLHLSLR